MSRVSNSIGIGLSWFSFSPSRAAVTMNTSNRLANTTVVQAPQACGNPDRWSRTAFEIDFCRVQLGRDDKVDFLARFLADCSVIPLPMPHVEVFVADTLEIVGYLSNLFDAYRVSSVRIRPRGETKLTVTRTAVPWRIFFIRADDGDISV